MYTQSGGILPVYIGRNQRGGGILSSIARFFLPTAKKLLKETVKAAPGVASAIMNNKQPVGKAILDGLKTAGGNTARAAFGGIGAAPRPRIQKRKAAPKRRQPTKKRRVAQQKDIFT
jgi:hypothetical protein